MENKTPKFNTLIDTLLSNITPSAMLCAICNFEFEITNDDIEVLKRFRVPPPKSCPSCRRQRRLAFLNYTTLYKRQCNTPGHNEMMISAIPEDAPFPVYDFSSYWSELRSPEKYAQEFKKSEQFISQLKNLFHNVPEVMLSRDPASTDSDYTNYGVELKNCYYTFGGLLGQNVDYSMWPLYTRDAMDILIALNSELVYEAVFPDHCNNCSYIYFSNNCIDSNFLYDCRGCSDCFGCVNLRNRRFCFLNEQLSEKQYRQKMSEINLGSRKTIEHWKPIFLDLSKSLPVRGTRNEHMINCVGNYILHAKNCFGSTWSLNSENLRYTDFVIDVRDSSDVAVSSRSECLYETAGTGLNSYNSKFSLHGTEEIDSEYMMNCSNCQNCFGCVGLENKSYCILNRQYEKETYWKIVDEIKTDMLSDGSYGSFFPLSMSPFPYNGTLAGVMYPREKASIQNAGGWWHDDTNISSQDIEIISSDDVPDDIRDVDDSILNKGILNKKFDRPFRIVKSELDFYRRKGLPIPIIPPYQRMIERFSYVNRFMVYSDVCVHCGKAILTSNEQKNGFLPYCNECYTKEII